MARIGVEISVDRTVVTRSEANTSGSELHQADLGALKIASEVILARARASSALNFSTSEEEFAVVLQALLLEADVQFELCSRALQTFFEVASGETDPADTKYADLLAY